MFSAGVSLMMMVFPMMAAKDIRLKNQLARQKVLHRLVCIAADAAVKLDSRLGQRGFGSAADPAADQGIHPLVPQKSRQRAMTASCCFHHLGSCHFSIFHLVDLELLCVAKVLKHTPVFISYCNFHSKFSFAKQKLSYIFDKKLTLRYNLRKNIGGKLMPVRQLMNKDEFLECGKIESIAFAYSWDQEEAKKELEKPDRQQTVTFGHFNEEGTLTACVMLPEYQVHYEGSHVPMVGVGGVASLPEYRFGGSVRQIFHTALRWMWDQGAVFSALYPFSHTYYRKFGYELCQLSTQFQIPAQALSPFRCTCQVRMFQPGQDLSPLKEIYNAHLGRYALAVQREDTHWEKLLGKDPYKERNYTYLLEEGSQPLAYIVMGVEDEPSSKIGNIKEVAFRSPEGLFQVFGMLYRLAAQYSSFRMILPSDVPIAALLEESYDLTATLSGHPMARVIRADKALEHKAPAEGSSYTVAVQDEILTENSGVFQVSNHQGAVSVKKLPEGSPADITLDIRVLAQLLLGYLSLEEALYKPGVTLSSNRETLESVFSKKAVFLTEYF